MPEPTEFTNITNLPDEATELDDLFFAAESGDDQEPTKKINVGKAVDKRINNSESIIVGGAVWPVIGRDGAKEGDTGLSNISALRDSLAQAIYFTSKMVSGDITALDFSAGTATIGGIDVTLHPGEYFTETIATFKERPFPVFSKVTLANDSKYKVTTTALYREEINDPLWTPRESENSFTINNGNIAINIDPVYLQLPEQNYNSVLEGSSNVFTNDSRIEITTDKDKSDLLAVATNWNYAFFTEPLVITRPDGRILTFSTVQYNTVNVNPPDSGQSAERADVIVKISDNNGEKYSPIKIVATQGDSYQNWLGGVAYDQNRNRVWVSFTSYKGLVGAGFSQKGFDENDTAQVYVTYSDDGGDTWESPTNITTDVKNPNHYLNWVPPTSAVTLPDGTIAIAMSSYKTIRGDITVGYIRLRPGSDAWEFAEEIVKDTEFSGTTGGEAALFIGRKGRLSAFVRTNIAGPKSAHRIYERNKIGWEFRNEIETSRVKAGIYFADPKLGFGESKLLVSAAHGKSADNLGRFNGFLFDGDDGTPIGGFDSRSAGNLQVWDYSDMTYMSNGAMYVVYVGVSSKVYGIAFTPNRVNGGPGYLKTPYMGIKQIASDELEGSKLDLSPNELIVNSSTNAINKFDGTKLINLAVNSKIEQTISTAVSTIDATQGEYINFLGTSDGSVITSITGGGYIGQEIILYVSSSGATITFKHSASHDDNTIQINPSKEGTLNDLQLRGGTAFPQYRTASLKWFGPGKGWLCEMMANA